MYPVFAKNSVVGEKPITWVSKEQKGDMLADGSARRFNRGKDGAIQLTRDKMIGDSTDFRDCSAQMGPSISEANADRKKWAMAIVEEWAKTGIPRMIQACKA